MKNFIQENFRGSGGHMFGGGRMIGGNPMAGGRRMMGGGPMYGSGRMIGGRDDMRMRLFRPQKPGISSYNRGFLYPQRHIRYKPYFYGGLYYYPYFNRGNYYYPYYYNNILYYYPYNSSYCFCENRDILDWSYIIDDQRCIRDKCGHYVPSSVCQYCQIV